MLGRCLESRFIRNISKNLLNEKKKESITISFFFKLPLENCFYGQNHYKQLQEDC